MNNNKIIKDEIEAWATEKGQEHVAIEISRALFLITHDNGQNRLHQIEDKTGNADWKAINNNRQQIFRWLRGTSPASDRKFSELIPAIEIALPADRLARVNGDDSVNYLASQAIKEFAAAMCETLLGSRDMSQRISKAVTALNAMRMTSA
ncbi:toxin YdaT family protein [Morganella psychrotolerans]|uniref:tRNA-(Guanine-N1)-methyltransferase n=1 Tax=Morganella psychrotolerans TaxID=368603 RepID=A0A1B8HKV9_9GAMM|nr:toxin YdaT family protein [Morganella psychrotolerans]OBU09830.1 tRNA-(guanine-N1)-methyltransferase [Morganella psychrotolerans]